MDSHLAKNDLRSFILSGESGSNSIPQKGLAKVASFNNKVVITNGFNATGKTLLAQLVAAMDNAELMTYAYELEWISSFFYIGEIRGQAYEEFVKLYVDNAINDHMMGRHVNVKVTDLSSIFNHRNTVKYIRRIFSRKNINIGQDIIEKRPILTLTGCHMFFVLPSISRALKDRLIFIEVVRDPMMIFPQLLILYQRHESPAGNETDFLLRTKSSANKAPFFEYFCGEIPFDDRTPENLSKSIVLSIERMFEFYFEFDFSNLSSLGSAFVLVPFEEFVMQPRTWLDKIIDLSNSRWSSSLEKEMKRQKVPRKLLSQGRDLPIYRRYHGNVEGKNAQSLDEEKEINREEVKRLITNPEIYSKLERLSDQYFIWSNSLPKPLFVEANS